MQQESQFKCVDVVSTLPTAAADNPQKQTLATLAALNWQINNCLISTNAGSLPPIGSTTNPSDPIIACSPSTQNQTEVVWAAVRIEDAASYRRGCINMCPGHPYLCPGSDPAQPPQPCYYVCGDTAATDGAALGDSSGYSILGEIPIPAMNMSTLGYPDGGYSVVPFPPPTAALLGVADAG
jgi:hypothetical protein